MRDVGIAQRRRGAERVGKEKQRSCEKVGFPPPLRLCALVARDHFLASLPHFSRPQHP